MTGLQCSLKSEVLWLLYRFSVNYLFTILIYVSVSLCHTFTLYSILSPALFYLNVESLRAAPNIDDIQVLVIPHVLLMWHVLGLQLGIHKAILSAIESDARRNRSILSKQAIEMFQLWLDGAEGTGDQHRSWSTILRALIKSGLSEVSIEVLKHFDPTATPKDIGQGEEVCVCVYMCVHTYVHTYYVNLCVFCICVLVTCVSGYVYYIKQLISM